MGYKAAVQVLKKADSLKQKLSTNNIDLLNDLQAWTDQQQLQTIYHQVLVLDLEYALDKKVEQELWMLGFKKHISRLQEQARDKKNPHRSESQALLSWCLEAASGFYLTLLQELCSTYDLDLPFRKRGPVYGKFRSNLYNDSNNLPQSSSCLYICQYCLVHLGDIARYRNQRRQAESFYKHAILVSPNSGHPYNQLALLEASQNDKLSTVFHYVRGIAVKNPFPGATMNLSNTLQAACDTDEMLSEIQTKMSLNDFINLFLRAHGLLHSDVNLSQAELCVKSINATLTALVATQSFTSEKLIKMTIINMYALKHTIGDDDIMKIDNLTEDERRTRALILDLIAGSLSAFLLPVYTLKNDESLLEYYALPAIRLILLWIRSNPSILTDEVFKNRLQIWPGYCKLLNIMQNYIKNDDYSKFSNIPLSYDRELQGFLSLQQAFKNYNFNLDVVDSEMEKHVRAMRLIDFAKWLTSHDVDGTKLIICKSIDDSTMFNFEPACLQPDPTDRLLEEMKSFKVNDIESKLKVPEKKGGILKPQGSLEKSREERDAQLKIACDDSSVTSQPPPKLTKMKRVTHNVALQSLYKRIEESKQVKFSAETTENEKTSQKMKASASSTPRIPQAQAVNHQMSVAPPSMPPYRTQAFNQNHPGLQLANHPNDNYYQANNQSNQIPFGNSDILNLPKLQANVNYPSMPQSSVPYTNQTQNNVPSFTPCIEKPMQFNYNYNPDVRSNTAAPNTWWPNHLNKQNVFAQQPPQQQQQQPSEYYARYQNQYNATNNSSSSDMFNPAWSTHTMRNPNYAANQQQQQQGMSMRQAMLNESKSSSNTLASNAAPGYSLFNPTSWSPALPGRAASNNNSSEVRQPAALFPTASNAPQSLQQLLEQQNQFQKGDT